MFEGSGVIVTLYSRPDCHLCDEARDELVAMREGGLRFELREVDISSDPELVTRYLERIPVVEVGGEIISELELDPRAVRARLGTVSA